MSGTVDALLDSAEDQSLESVYLKMVGRQQEELNRGDDDESSTN